MAPPLDLRPVCSSHTNPFVGRARMGRLHPTVPPGLTVGHVSMRYPYYHMFVELGSPLRVSPARNGCPEIAQRLAWCDRPRGLPDETLPCSTGGVAHCNVPGQARTRFDNEPTLTFPRFILFGLSPAERVRAFEARRGLTKLQPESPDPVRVGFLGCADGSPLARFTTV